MKLYLRDINPAMTLAWRLVFKDDPDVEVSQGDIFGLQIPIDAIVSPANSYGFMDGGIDYWYSQYFGWDMQERLQQILADQYDGELLVGQAVVVATNNKRIPWCISAPTMRVPTVIKDTVNAYLAFRAALKVAKMAGINSMLCPGLGTAVGRMQPEMCAVQMVIAWKEFKEGKKSVYPTLQDAAIAHHSLKGLQIEVRQETDIDPDLN